jgi:hypothetical protein
MSHWATKYTDAQRAGVVDAVLERGMSSPAATRAAAAGELPGLEPFTMPVPTARDLVRKERERRADIEAKRAAREDPRAAVQAMVAQLLGDARAELERMRQGATDSAEQWEKLRTAARAIGEIERVARAVHREAGGNGDTGNGDTELERPAGLIERLAAGAGETATAGPGSPNPAGTHGERDRDAARPAETTGSGTTQNTRETERTENGVRVGAEGKVDGRSSEREAAAARARAVLEASV